MSFNDLSRKEAAGKAANEATPPKPKAGTEESQAADPAPGAGKKA